MSTVPAYDNGMAVFFSNAGVFIALGFSSIPLFLLYPILLINNYMKINIIYRSWSSLWYLQVRSWNSDNGSIEA